MNHVYQDGVIVYTTFRNGCLPNVSSDVIRYVGSNLPNTGINYNDNLTLSIQKIDTKLIPQALAEAVIYAINNIPSVKTSFCSAIDTCP